MAITEYHKTSNISHTTNKSDYPLGHQPAELDRLDNQALLLRDPLLEELAAKSKSCLEIGCGNGSNLSILRQANPHLNYTGIDISPEAIAAANLKYCSNNTNFLTMDGSSINLKKGQFDLVFTKLVLWSVGPAWAGILKQAYDLLAPGGIFYAFEPCNQFIEMQPVKPAAKAWMNAWDQAAIKKGLDPYIGTKVATQMNKANFANIGTKFFSVVATGSDVDKYKSIVDNLQGFYMGPAAEHLELTANTTLDPGTHIGISPDTKSKMSSGSSATVTTNNLKAAAVTELNNIHPGDLVMDALFVTWGSKHG